MEGIHVPVRREGNYQPGAADMIFRMGYLRQNVQIAGMEVKDCGRGVALGDLPFTKPDYHYAGMEPGAPWRAEGQARIEKFRKSQLSIHVTNASGHAVKGRRSNSPKRSTPSMPVIFAMS